VWDVATGRERATLKGPQLVWSMAFSPDGKTLASASMLGTVLLWDMHTGKRTATLQRFNPSGREEDINPAFSVAFSPDGRVLAVGTLRGITLWDVKSETEKDQVPTMSGSRRRHSAIPYITNGLGGRLT